MGGLTVLFLVLSTLLTATRGFLIGYDELAGFVNVSNTVHALTISDYYAQFNGGGIVAYSLNLTGDLSAATADFGFLHTMDASTEDLTALNTWTPSATFGALQVSGNASLHSPATVQGELHVRGESMLGDLDVLSLVATNETTIDGILFAQSNVQVTQDLIVRGNTRIFGDFLANSSLTVGINLEVHDEVQIHNHLMVDEELHTRDLTVEGTATIGRMEASGWVNTTESASVGMNLDAMMNGEFSGSLSAHDGDIHENFNGKGTLTVNGYLKSVKTATVEDFTVQGDLSVQSWTTVAEDAEFQQDLSVAGNLEADVDISSSGTLAAVDGVFSTLSVDTATLETLTATFVTSTNLEATDATIGNSFMSGITTLDILEVETATTLTTAEADSVDGDSVNAGSATLGSLEVSTHGDFVFVEVKSSIIVGSPSQTDFFGAFDTGSADMFNWVKLDAAEGDITNVTGLTFTYGEVFGQNITGDTLWAMGGYFDAARATMADVNDTLNSNSSWIDHVEVSEMEFLTLEAENGWFEDGDFNLTESEWINATDVTIDALSAENILVQTLEATSATVQTLHSDQAWLTKLTSTNSTITNLWSTTAVANSLLGDDITYDEATVTTLTTQNGESTTFDSTRSISSSWLWARETNFSTLDSKTLRVTGGWLNNPTLQDDLTVKGQSTLEMGFIAGPTVVADLDVVESSLLDGLSATGTSFFTDLMVKRVTITDDFQANEAQLGATTVDTLKVTGATTVLGGLTVTSDSLLGGNLVVVGTTQFQTGSFSRIGTALITTTDMEAFNLNAAEGTFGEIETSDFLARRAVNFERSINLDPLLGDISGSTHSLFMQIAPTTFTAETSTETFDVNTLAYLHTGNASIDALVVTSSTNASVAALRFKGDGSIDLMDGDILFDELNIGGGVEFENENNVAFPLDAPNVTLAQGEAAPFYFYSDLVDRDLVAPGSAFNPTRFHEPTSATDLLTLSSGHYRISGQVYLAPSAAATTSIVAIAQASIGAWLGSESDASPAFWSTSCIANFNLVTSSTWGGSCSFSDVLVVSAGQTVTLRTSISWPFSSAPSTDTLTVRPISSVQVSEYFERTSEGL